MKIGIALGFFDFRNDVRNLIKAVLEGHEVVVFCLARDRDTVASKLPTGAELRIIDEKKTGLRNKIYTRFFQLLKRLPKSRHNYYLMEHFKISLNPDRKARAKATALLEASQKLPHIMAYDYYLSKLDYNEGTKIDDLDRIIFFTDIVDDAFFARTINENKKPVVYVYSWDHPCKHYKYSQRVDYLCWHDGIKTDLEELQGIETSRITTLGASQFCYIDMYNTLKKNPHPRIYDFPYVYFGCAIGIPQLVHKEIEIIENVSKALVSLRSELKLIVRPYPVLNDWGYYDKLRESKYIIIDDSYRTTDLSVADDDIMDKFRKIDEATAFIHLGTTMGYEACFTDTPSFIIDYGYGDSEGHVSMENFVHQYQNKKYLLLDGFDNVITSEHQLQRVLSMLEKDSSVFTEYNHAVSANMAPSSFDGLAGKLASYLQAGV